jgi:O-antigen ligase
LSCLAGAWHFRAVAIERLQARRRLTTLWLLAAVAVSSWFLLNVLLVSKGSLPHTFAGQLVLWSLPAAVLAFSLPAPLLRPLAALVAGLAGLYLIVEIAALAHHPEVSRYSPIASLDPISAAQIPALGATALLALRPETPERVLSYALGFVALCAGAVLPGSRGPVLALVVGVGVAAVLWLARRPKRLAGVVAALVLGLGLGYAGTRLIGSAAYLTAGTGTSASVPYSTVNIRREWWGDAVRGIPDAPVFGHGVAMLVDDTPEAQRMGVAGQRTYPHNSPLESLYSLGVVGAIPYFVLLVSAIAALVLLVRRRARVSTFAAALYGFSFAAANVSGEIGADAALWVAGALAVALYADGPVSARESSREPASTRRASSPS